MEIIAILALLSLLWLLWQLVKAKRFTRFKQQIDSELKGKVIANIIEELALTRSKQLPIMIVIKQQHYSIGLNIKAAFCMQL